MQLNSLFSSCFISVFLPVKIRKDKEGKSLDKMMEDEEEEEEEEENEEDGTNIHSNIV